MHLYYITNYVSCLQFMTIFYNYNSVSNNNSCRKINHTAAIVIQYDYFSVIGNIPPISYNIPVPNDSKLI